MGLRLVFSGRQLGIDLQTVLAQRVCKACMLLEGLNQGLPRLGISRSRGAAIQANGHDPEASSRSGYCLQDGSIAGQAADGSAASVHRDSAVAQHPSARTQTC